MLRAGAIAMLTGVVGPTPDLTTFPLPPTGGTEVIIETTAKGVNEYQELWKQALRERQELDEKPCPNWWRRADNEVDGR